MKPAQNPWDPGARIAAELTRAKYQALLRSQKKNWDDDYFYSYGIFLHDGTLIGTLSAMEVSRSVAQSCYLGYGIFNPYWGRGYAKEAVRAFLDLCFRDLHLHRVEAGVEPRNRRSIMLARSLGMRKEGLKRRAVLLRGKWQDLVMYTLTCEEMGIKWKHGRKGRTK